MYKLNKLQGLELWKQRNPAAFWLLCLSILVAIVYTKIYCSRSEKLKGKNSLSKK